MPIAPLVLDLSRSSDRIVGRENPDSWNFPSLETLWAGNAGARR